jgi:undecaprenyl-diphosphatase
MDLYPVPGFQARHFLGALDLARRCGPAVFLNLDYLCLAWFHVHHSPFLDLVMKAISAVTSSPMCCLWAGLMAVVLMFKHRFSRAFILFSGTVIASILVSLLKLSFSRLRPPTSTIYDSYSFPSGHALSSMVFFGLFAWLLSREHPARRNLIYAVAAVLTLWVGLSRVYLGFHWPSDVIGGFVIGFIFLRSWLWITQIP